MLIGAQCWFAFQCAACFAATVLACEKWPIRASLQPLGVYIYAFGSQSCATRLIFAGSAPLAAAKQAALGTLGCWAPSAAARHSLRGKARLLPRAASTVRSAILRRRIRLLVSRTPAGASREPEPRRSPAFVPSVRRLGPDLPLWCVFLRSLCARRHPVASLNCMRQQRDKFVAQAISNAQTGILQGFRRGCPQKL